MAKTMARIQNGVVVNLEWVNDTIAETDELKNVNDLQIEIGDAYVDNKFYRNGVEIVTFRHLVRKTLENYEKVLDEIEEILSISSIPSESESPTIDDRKRAIISYLEDMFTAFNTLEITPIE